jgi:phosphopantetheinyl transferase
MPTVTLTLARVTPDDRDDWLEIAASLLSDRERQRLDAILDRDRRAQHAIGRALLRLIGAGAGGGQPADVEITTSGEGKPELAELPELGISLAHSGRAVVVAACEGAPVGVDIEPTREASANSRRLADRRFSAPEAAALRELPDAAVSDWFARAWTTKEAVGKALGVGMIPALAGAVVNSRADALVSVWSGPPADSWTLHQLPAPGGDEWIAVAIPAPGIALGAVAQLTLEAFSETAGADRRVRESADGRQPGHESD